MFETLFYGGFVIQFGLNYISFNPVMAERYIWSPVRQNGPQRKNQIEILRIQVVIHWSL